MKTKMLAAAIAKRKSAETLVPIIAADIFEGDEAVRQRGGCERDQDGKRDDHRRVAEGEEEADRPGRLPSCISFRVTLSIAARWSASKAWRTPML